MTGVVRPGAIRADEPPLPTEAQALAGGFFERDPRDVARDLIGCALVSRKHGEVTGGRIVETEAYLGANDPGSHAATRGMTSRNVVMYGASGRLYVYFTYGNHHMLNLVCEPEGIAGAVLIRAIEPLWGIETMASRRGGRPSGQLADGPGKLAEALGIDLSDNATPLDPTTLAVYTANAPESHKIATSGRIGLAKGHEHEYRFFLRDSTFVSRGRTGPARRNKPGLKRQE